MKEMMAKSHIPSVCAPGTKYSSEYGQWLQGYKWTYILTIRRHFPLTIMACIKMAKSLLHYSSQITTIWMVLEKDRGDNMNHLHIILETGTLRLIRKEMVEALGIKHNPKMLSYFLIVDFSNGVARYCAKHIGKSHLFHDLYTQSTIHMI